MIITCYSYKGGSGRSTAAVNIAGSLFRMGKKVACLDMDFGAPGLHEILITTGSRGKKRDWEPVHPRIKEAIDANGGIGIHHFFNQSVSGKKFVAENGINFKNLYFPEDERNSTMFKGMKDAEAVSSSIKKGELIFFTASQKEKSIEPISGKHYDLESFKDRFCLMTAEVVKFFYENDNEEKNRAPLTRDTFDAFYDDIYMICDSASGITANSLPVLNISNMILTFFRWSAQHLKGTQETCATLKRYLEERYVFGKVRMYKVGSIKPIINVGNDEEKKNYGDVVLKKAAANIDEKLKELKLDIDFKYLGDIPEEESMKFFERIITLSGNYNSYTLLIDAYDKVAKMVVMERDKIDDFDIRNRIWKYIYESR